MKGYMMIHHIRDIEQNQLPIIESDDVVYSALANVATMDSEINMMVRQLMEKDWFIRSKADVRGILIQLAPQIRGFLRDLLARPSEGGGVRLVRLQSILYPHDCALYGILINFEVEKISNPEIKYCYQHFEWKQGHKSGSKGVVLLENEGKITHIICRYAFAFAAGKKLFDTFGGFADSVESVTDLLKVFERELKEEIGIPDLKVKRYIPLGEVHIDRGMTSNCPDLFAAVIDGKEASKISKDNQNCNTDIFEMTSSIFIWPIQQIRSLITINTDSLFLACIARLYSELIID